MDDELRDAERRASELKDAASTLAWAVALRRAGRDQEGAAAAFLARARGASPEDVSPLARPREGGGDALAPWPHPRGDSAGTRRSRVEGPTERAKLLHEIDLGAEDAAWGHGPIVLPDGSLVVSLDRTEHGGSYVKCFAPDGGERWTAGLRENISPPVALASGELVVATAREAIYLLAASGEEVRRVPIVARALFREVMTWFVPAAWNRSVVLGDRVIASDGVLQDDLLRAPGERRLRGRSATVGPDGSVYIPAKAYSVEKTPRAGGVPALLVDPLALHAFGREGEHRWSRDLELDDAQVAVTRDSVLVRVRAELLRLDRATGEVVERRPFAGPLALDPAGAPIALAPFGPAIMGAPVVDAAGRRYAATERGELVGLSPEGRTLFSVALALTRESLTGTLALGAGRLFALVLRSRRRSIVCVGDA